MLGSSGKECSAPPFVLGGIHAAHPRDCVKECAVLPDQRRASGRGLRSASDVSSFVLLMRRDLPPHGRYTRRLNDLHVCYHSMQGAGPSLISAEPDSSLRAACNNRPVVFVVAPAVRSQNTRQELLQAGRIFRKVSV